MLVEPAALLEAVKTVAAEAARRIMVVYESAFEVHTKEDESPLTAADRAAHEAIVAGLKALTPEVPVLSEEGSQLSFAERSRWARYWLVDPLDGTKEFIKQRTDFTINVGLISDGEPIFGLVYAPARSLLALTLDGGAFEAELMPSEHGANLDGLRLHRIETRAPGPDGLVAVVSRSHLDPATEAFLAKLTIAGKSSAGSSLKFIEVARGDADVYPRFGPTMEWDTAAGHAVLLAAGGMAFAADGGPLRYGKTAAGLRNAGFIAWGSTPLA